MENIRSILKTALPHQSDYIDKVAPEQFHYLLDELETLLLGALRAMLEGIDEDEADVKRAAEITDQVKKIQGERKQA